MTSARTGQFYTNESNPFNDPQLNIPFDWVKKRERDERLYGREGMRQRLQERQREVEIELEKLKKARQARDEERKWMEGERYRTQRAREEEQLGDWQAKEQEFHLVQAKKRAATRIVEHRASPVDLFVLQVNVADEREVFEDCEVMIDSVTELFWDLTLKELQTLKNEVQFFIDHETKPAHQRYWQLVMLICQDELVKAQNCDADPQLKRSFSRHQYRLLTAIAFSRSAQTAVPRSVIVDIHSLLGGKSLDELNQLHQDVEKKLQSDQLVDVEYWETLLKALMIFKARAQVDVIHQRVVHTRLDQLKFERRMDEYHKLKKAFDNHHQTRQRHVSPEPSERPARAETELEPSMSTTELPSNPTEKTPGEWDESEAAIQLFQLEQERDLEQGEEYMAPTALVPDEVVPADQQQPRRPRYHWQDKYRPRKPRFYNRVLTGYEWNKYNQTHYDSANPPPKVVQGYKFNVFYPDLIDKSQPPEYELIPDPLATEENETILVKFHAGPPYEDIAFRIVNREWELSHRRGFKCVFERGVLSLWFKFRRDRA